MDEGQNDVGAAVFPAEEMVSTHAREDLMLEPRVKKALEDLVVRAGKALKHDRKTRSRQGYRALFHGPSGTGKTMAAATIAQRLDLPIWRIDLSGAVSKYINETQKNLAALFERAEERGIILFFDEADALFGKRTEAGDSHDRYANQEIEHLLRRIETYEGIVIVATNLPADEDGPICFQTVIRFPRRSGRD